jgi:hypothetical protein
MSGESDTEVQALARSLLILYEQALRLRQVDTAENLLCALEELAAGEEDCCALRDRAYLEIGHREANM